MDSTFGAPVFQQDDPAADVTTAAPNGQTTTQQLAAIDPNDPRLVSEVLDDRLDADAYAVPPPPPDGRWKAKLKLGGIKDKADGQIKPFIVGEAYWRPEKPLFYAANVEASLIDHSGKNDNVKLMDYHVRSLMDDRKGTSPMTTITQKAGGAANAHSTAKDRYQAFEKALAAEPEVIVETRWQVSCQRCEEAADKRGDKKPGPFLYGDARFPQNRDGSHSPDVSCPTCKSMCRAQAKIERYYSLKEIQPTRGLA